MPWLVNDVFRPPPEHNPRKTSMQRAKTEDSTPYQMMGTMERPSLAETRRMSRGSTNGMSALKGLMAVADNSNHIKFHPILFLVPLKRHLLPLLLYGILPNLSIPRVDQASVPT